MGGVLVPFIPVKKQTGLAKRLQVRLGDTQNTKIFGLYNNPSVVSGRKLSSF